MSMGNTPFMQEGVEVRDQPYENRLAFARDAFERCKRFGEMVEAARPTA
jgi:hypothetical protein